MIGEGLEVRLFVNGAERVAIVSPRETLLGLLRDELMLTGTKYCCMVGECGACTVSLDNRIVDACLVLAMEADGHRVETIEGVAAGEQLTVLQEMFLERGAVQCGFCTPGQLMAALDLLGRSPSPTSDEVAEGLAGNLCRCGCYGQIRQAVVDAGSGRE